MMAVAGAQKHLMSKNMTQVVVSAHQTLLAFNVRAFANLSCVLLPSIK